MEWKIEIESKKNAYILVKFLPLRSKLLFLGMYKPKNKEWEALVELESELIQEKTSIIEHVSKVYEVLITRIEILDNLDNEIFSKIKVIGDGD